MNLLEMGYVETKPLLYMKELASGVRIYHDYRSGKRWSYAFDGSESVNVKLFKEYQDIKLREEAEKCKTLNKF